MFYFQIVRPLGQGGLGVVDVVQVTAGDDYPVGTLLARKRLGPQWANEPNALARFDREISMLQQMRHPGIVSLAGAYIKNAGAEPCYTMPLYPRSLRHALTRPIDWRWTAQFGIKIADALRYAHSKNFIHRDLKPENILLDQQDNPVIADWGLGQFIHQHSKVLDLRTRAGLGTPYYCPVEQWSTGKCEPSGDVYALGLILAEMVAGSRHNEPAFSGIRKDLIPNATIGASWFNATIRKMTQTLAQNRHQTMQEVINDLSMCS